MSKRCDQCLFSDKKIVSDEAKQQILQDIRIKGNFFVCHKASIGGIGGGCCKAFFDQSEDGIVVAVKRMGMPVQWIDPDTMEEVTK